MCVVHMCLCVCMCECMHTCACVCVSACMHVPGCVCARAHVCTQACVHACVCLPVCFGTTSDPIVLSADIPVLVKTGKWRDKPGLLEDAAARMEFFFHQNKSGIHIKNSVIFFMNKLFPLKGEFTNVLKS